MPEYKCPICSNQMESTDDTTFACHACHTLWSMNEEAYEITDTNIPIATIHSSNGEIIINAITGKVDCFESDDTEFIKTYENAVFDLNEYKSFYKVDELPDEYDILDLGYTIDGKYEPPEPDFRNEVMRNQLEKEDEMNAHLKTLDCDYCGESMNIWIEKENDKKICNDCNKFLRYKFKRSHHLSWIIRMALDSLEDKINRNQKELYELKTMNDLGMPFYSYKLESDTREKRIDSINEFLEQYYDIHEWLKQMFKIVRHKDSIDFANDLAIFFRNRNK